MLKDHGARGFNDDQTACKRYWAAWVNLIHKAVEGRAMSTPRRLEPTAHTANGRHAFLMRSAPIRPLTRSFARSSPSLGPYATTIKITLKIDGGASGEVIRC